MLRPYKKWSVLLWRGASAEHLSGSFDFVNRSKHRRQDAGATYAHPMTGKRYYLTTIGAWHRHAVRFANSHWLALGTASPGSDSASAQDITPAGTACCAPTEPGVAASEADSTRILVLIEGDEGAHLALEDDAAFEALPHPLAQKPISEAAQAALAVFGVAPGATTFDAAEAVATAHPLLRHRVF